MLWVRMGTLIGVCEGAKEGGEVDGGLSFFSWAS